MATAKTKTKTEDNAKATAPKAGKGAAKPATAAAPAEAKKAAPEKLAEAKSETPKKSIGKPVTPSKELAAVIGAKDAMPRTEVVSKVWDYIRKHGLQDPSDKRNIKADATLKAVFGKDEATMFELNKLLSGHLS